MSVAEPMTAQDASALAARKREIEKELRRIAGLKKPLGRTKKKAKALREELIEVDARLGPTVIPCPEPEPEQPPGQRLAKIYARPKNVYLRLIEFEDGEYGVMRIRPTSRLGPGWNVLVEPGEAGQWRFIKEWP